VYPHSRALQLQLRASIQGQDVRTSGSRFVSFFDNFLEADRISQHESPRESYDRFEKAIFVTTLEKNANTHIGIEHQTNRIVRKGLSI